MDGKPPPNYFWASTLISSDDSSNSTTDIGTAAAGRCCCFGHRSSSRCGGDPPFGAETIGPGRRWDTIVWEVGVRTPRAGSSCGPRKSERKNRNKKIKSTTRGYACTVCYGTTHGPAPVSLPVKSTRSASGHAGQPGLPAKVIGPGRKRLKMRWAGPGRWAGPRPMLCIIHGPSRASARQM